VSLAHKTSYYKAAKTFSVFRNTVRHWYRRYFNKALHSQGCGGVRHAKFYSHELPVVITVLLHFLRHHPTSTFTQVHSFLRTAFVPRVFSKSTTSRVLKKIGWTWRVPTRFQIHKYTLNNIVRYTHYLTVVQGIQWKHLKFIDEAHVVSKQLTSRRVLGLKNSRTWTRESTIHHAHATLTLLTSLSTPSKPVRCAYTESTNTQWSFCDFVVACCVRKDLIAGDFLICDNAAIHGAEESQYLLTTQSFNTMV